MNVEQLMEQSASRLFRDGGHLPLIVVAFEGSEVIVRERVTPFPGSSERRQHVLFLLGRQFATRYGTQNIATVWFVCEAWFSEARPHTPYTPPSLNPRRREALYVIELDAQSLSQQIALREMVRDRRGKLKAVQPLPELSSQEVTSSLVGVLALSFLAGFAEASGHADAKAIQTRILWHQHQMDRWLGPR